MRWSLNFHAGESLEMRVTPTQCGWVHISGCVCMYFLWLIIFCVFVLCVFEHEKCRIHKYINTQFHRWLSTHPSISDTWMYRWIACIDESQCLRLSPMDACAYFVAGKTLNKHNEFSNINRSCCQLFTLGSHRTS